MSERSNNAAVRRRRNRKDKEREKREREAKRRNRLEAPENRGPGRRIDKEEREKRANMTPEQRRKYLERQAEKRRAENKRNAERRQNASPGEEYVGPGDNPVVTPGTPGGGTGTGTTPKRPKGVKGNPKGDFGPDNKRGKADDVFRKRFGDDGVKRNQKGKGRKQGGGMGGDPGMGGGMPTQGGIRGQIYNMPIIQGIMAERAARREARGGGGGFPSIVGAMFGGSAPTRPNVPSRAGPFGASTGEHSVSSSGGRNRSSGSLAEDFATGRISRDEFERQMGTSGRPTPRGGSSSGGRSQWPNPLTTPGHQQTSRARPPSPGGNFPPQGQTGRARPPANGSFDLLPRRGQTGRAAPPSDWTPNQPRPSANRSAGGINIPHIYGDGGRTTSSSRLPSGGYGSGGRTTSSSRLPSTSGRYGSQDYNPARRVSVGGTGRNW